MSKLVFTGTSPGILLSGFVERYPATGIMCYTGEVGSPVSAFSPAVFWFAFCRVLSFPVFAQMM